MPAIPDSKQKPSGHPPTGQKSLDQQSPDQKPSDQNTPGHPPPGPAHDHFLDVSGLVCPLPVLKARKKLLSLERGTVLLLCMTDPDAPQDLRGLFRKFNAEIISEHTNSSDNTLSWMWVRIG